MIRVDYVALHNDVPAGTTPNEGPRASHHGKVKRKWRRALCGSATTDIAEYGPVSMINITTYLGLFIVAFGAATILPFQSEPVLIGLLVLDKFPVPGLIVVASAGNILGAVCNWVLGRGIDRFQHKVWFPVKKSSLERASGWYRRYGRWSLLLSWMPLFGDALTVVAGVLREPLWSFLALVTVAKTGRYLVLAAAMLGTKAAIGF